MRSLFLIVLLVSLGACQRDEAPQLRASCKPHNTNDAVECTLENVGKKAARGCVTARVQIPKAQPLIAKRRCTAPIEPGAKIVFTPKFDGVESLQPKCSPDGQWICTADVVEAPEQLTQNIGDGK
jgi:hypothetical protein